MAKARKGRVDSAAGAVGAFDAAGSIIAPPNSVTLPAEAAVFWPDIVCARARDEWTGNDLLHAVNLACCYADIERLKAEIRAEGDIVTNARGTEVVNPRHALLEVVTRRAVCLVKLLQLDAVVNNDRRDVVRKRKAERDARAVIESAAEESLLA